MLTISSKPKACLPRARAELALTGQGRWAAALEPGNGTELVQPRVTPGKQRIERSSRVADLGKR